MESKTTLLLLATLALAVVCTAKPYHKSDEMLAGAWKMQGPLDPFSEPLYSPVRKGHAHFHAKVFRQELSETASVDEPQGRLGDSERWMSWEPKAPLAVPDNIGDSTEDEDEDTDEDPTIEEDEEADDDDSSEARKEVDVEEEEEEEDVSRKPEQHEGESVEETKEESRVLPLVEAGKTASQEGAENGEREEGGSQSVATTRYDKAGTDPGRKDVKGREDRAKDEKNVGDLGRKEGKTGPETTEERRKTLVSPAPKVPPSSQTEESQNVSTTASIITQSNVLLRTGQFELPMKTAPVFDSIREKDLCASVYCHYGRVCEKGLCVCAPSDYCRGHSKAVCGTDGVTYPSHCELHRMACVNGRHIGIDHSGKRCLLATNAKNDPKPVETFVFDDLSLRRDESKVVAKKAPGQQEAQDEQHRQADYTGDTLEDPERPIKVPRMDEPKLPCTELEYEQLKSNLMQYHCARIGEPDCSSNSPRKQFVANIMFNYYDRNSNQVLDEAELEDVEHRDHLEKLSRFCGLADMLAYDDKQEDGNISLPEFYTAFQVPTVLLDEDLKVFTTRVTAGNSIELKCDIRGAADLVWKRNGGALGPLTSPDIKTFDDGSLYISNIGLHHMGNYTCQDRYNDHVIQTHILHVQLAPRVRVSPSTQFHTSGSSVTLKCHADGVPEPDIMWEMNESPLSDDPQGQHYLRMHNNATLEIRRAIYTKDTGAYKCKARNSAGTGQDIATVFIENSNVPKYYTSEDLYEVFLVFHDKGYTAYEPSHCHIEHQVSGSFSMFKLLPEYGNPLPTLCPEGEPCSWGHAANVRNKFIYISQPKLNRVIVIEIQDRSNPIEVIPTDKVPVQVEYIEHLDQVWILCWNDENEGGSKTIVVVRQASEDMQHHTVHTQPIANRFDLVKDMFLPPNNDLQHRFPYGYVVHVEQRGLYKLELASMKYVKNIDLNKYDCVPKTVAFIAMGGQVIVHCQSSQTSGRKSWQLVLDYVTDAVLSETQLTGDAYVSPDGRYVVVIDDEGDTITVHKVLDDGTVTKVYDEYTNLHVAGVTFFPSERGRSYDFYASSVNKNDVLYMNLASGKVEMIEGVGQAIKPEEWKWSRHNRVIVSGGVFGEYLMTPSRDSIVVIDGRRRHVQCEWQDIAHGNIIVWVEPMHL